MWDTIQISYCLSHMDIHATGRGSILFWPGRLTTVWIWWAVLFVGVLFHIPLHSHGAVRPTSRVQGDRITVRLQLHLLKHRQQCTILKRRPLRSMDTNCKSKPPLPCCKTPWGSKYTIQSSSTCCIVLTWGKPVPCLRHMRRKSHLPSPSKVPVLMFCF